MLAEEPVDHGEKAVEPHHDYNIYQTQDWYPKSGLDTCQPNVMPHSSGREHS